MLENFFCYYYASCLKRYYMLLKWKESDFCWGCNNLISDLYEVTTEKPNSSLRWYKKWHSNKLLYSDSSFKIETMWLLCFFHILVKLRSSIPRIEFSGCQSGDPLVDVEHRDLLALLRGLHSTGRRCIWQPLVRIMNEDLKQINPCYGHLIVSGTRTRLTWLSCCGGLVLSSGRFSKRPLFEDPIWPLITSIATEQRPPANNVCNDIIFGPEDGNRFECTLSICKFIY